MRSRQKILEFRRGCGHAVPCNLASDAGEGDAVALGLYVGRILLKNSEVRLLGIGVAAR